MQTTEKIFKYDPQVYPISLHVAVSADLKSILSGYEEPDGSSIRDDEWGNLIAATYYNIRERKNHLAVILVVFRDKVVDPGSIAHEAKHAADRIFDYIGEENTRHESHACLVEWVVNCINKALKEQ